MNKLHYRMLLSAAILLIFSGTMPAQNIDSSGVMALTVQETRDFAVEHNYELQNTELDYEIANKQKWETTAIGLPTVSASAEYQNFPDIPTQLFPNFITPAVVGVNTELFGLTPLGPIPEGEKMPVQFGSKHNTKYGISVSQLIFSGEYIVGLKASKIYLELSKTAHLRKKEEVQETVTNTYYLILITEQSISALDSVYTGLQKLKNETAELAAAGFIDKTDVRQIELNVKNTENSLNSVKQQKELLYRLLKFQAGINYETSLILSSGLDSIILEIESGALINMPYDIYSDNGYRMMQVQESLSELELQREKSTVLPQLSAFFSYSQNAMQDELDLFSEDAEWYPTTVWGLNLSVPIFSSGGRWARIKQKEFSYHQSVNSKEHTRQAMLIDYYQTRSNYITSYNSFKNTETGKILAKDVYENTLIKYKTGTVSGMDLTQAQNQYFMAISEYYRNLGELIELHVKLKRMLKQY